MFKSPSLTPHAASRASLKPREGFYIHNLRFMLKPTKKTFLSIMEDETPADTEDETPAEAEPLRELLQPEAQPKLIQAIEKSPVPPDSLASPVLAALLLLAIVSAGRYIRSENIGARLSEFWRKFKNFLQNITPK